MPGRPHRHIQFRRFLDRRPGLVLTLSGKRIQLPTKDKMLLLESIIMGLLQRIERKNRKEAEYLLSSFPRLEEQFAALIVEDKVNEAYQAVAKQLSRYTIPDLMRRLIEPTPLDLSKHASDLLSNMPQKSEMKKRNDWVSKFGLDPYEATEPDGALVELILAHHYDLPESRIHKILAGASKFLS